jgi:predicted dehydrogenase
VCQLSIRYPERLPAHDTRYDLAEDPQAVSFLDHVCHPMAILRLLGGEAESMIYLWDAKAGGAFAMFNMRGGTIASWHSSGGQSGNAPAERVEVVGNGAHIVIENTIRMTYYRPGPTHYYGRIGNFVTDDDIAPLHWEPECSRGILFNDKLFFLGYAPEVRAFCDSVLNNTPPERAGLRDTWMQVQIYEAFANPAGTMIDLPPPPDY